MEATELASASRCSLIAGAGSRPKARTRFEEIAGAGGLIGYGVDLVETIRHAASFVDKILKGAKPADIPFEQASKFKLAINLRTAATLGLTIPQSLLLRADKAIQ